MDQNDNLLQKLFKIINIAGTAILMNLMFLLCSLPIVTIGQAWCGLLSAIRFNIRGESWFAGFKQGFKTRLLRGILSFTLIGALCVFMTFNTAATIIQGLDAGDTGFIFPAVLSVAFTLIPMMFITSLILLNVYIPTKPGRWLENAMTLTFTAPLQMAACGILLWCPLILFMGVGWLFWLVLLAFIAVYFILAALGITILAKDPLITILLQEREAGTLTEDRLDELQEELEDLDGTLE